MIMAVHWEREMDLTKDALIMMSKGPINSIVQVEIIDEINLHLFNM
jgi:hypothetical protein